VNRGTVSRRDPNNPSVSSHSGEIDVKTMIRRRQRGQGMTEYIIIVALIAVAAIGVYSFFGETVREQTSAIANEVAGQSGTAAIARAGTAADSAGTSASTTKGLSNFDAANNQQATGN
jgi:Flp pilus assembly pilin Flp